MNSISFRLVSFLLSLVALTVVCNNRSARAETPNTDVSVERFEPAVATTPEVELVTIPVATSERIEHHSTISVESPKLAAATTPEVEPATTPVATSKRIESHSTVSVESPKLAAATTPEVELATTPGTAVEPLAINPTFTKIPEDMTGQASVQQAHLAHSNNNQADSQRLQPEVSTKDQQVSSKAADAAPGAKPTPGSLATSATLLTAPLQTSPEPKASSNQADSTIAQTEIQPGQATRGGRSYIGIGGNIGFGDTGLGSGAFAINSKIGLNSFISVRPAVLFGDDVNFLIPVTYDFTIESDDPFAPVPFAPFVGGGVVISTADDNNIGFLLTGGVDVPLSREFVANATLNIGFLEDSTDVGIMLGVGYTFPNFIR